MISSKKAKSKWVTWWVEEQIQLKTGVIKFRQGWLVPDRGWQEVQWTLSSVCQSPLPAGFLVGFSVAWVGGKQMSEQRMNGLAEILQLGWASRYSQRVSQLAGVLLRSQQRNCSLQLGRWPRGKGMIYRNTQVLFKSDAGYYIWQQIHYSRTIPETKQNTNKWLTLLKFQLKDGINRPMKGCRERNMNQFISKPLWFPIK